VGHRRDHQTEVVDVGKGEPPGDLTVQARNINNEQERGDWGPLGGADRNWGKDLGTRLVEKPA